MKRRAAAPPPSSATPIIEISGLRVERGSTVILRNISWRVERGQHWTILGPNGCGKTSLLRALTGYLSPSSGSLAALGLVYGECDWRELRFKVGLVTSSLQMSIPPAEPAIETVMSGKYAQLDLWAPTTPADHRTALRWLRFADATHLADREWIFLSQGERQRVLIARALMANPRLLILDEPCAGLDPLARETFLDFIGRLARRRGGPSLVLVTHHVEEIRPAFTHTLLLRAGTVVASGPIRTTLTDRTLAATFGAPVRLRRRDGRWSLNRAPATRTSRSS